jgi:hypothetical protein
MRLMYWVVRCHTKDCVTIHPAKLLGEFNEKARHVIPDHAPKFFDLDCPNCRKRHTYAQSDLYVTDLGERQPPIFEERW